MCIRAAISSIVSLLHILLLALPAACADTSLEVTWISPAGGDSYASGTYIIGQWRSPQEINTPTFKLCSSPEYSGLLASEMLPGGGVAFKLVEADVECGSPVQPQVDRGSDGSYQATLALPNVTPSSSFLIEMVDGLDHTSSSPIFTLTSSREGLNTTTSELLSSSDMDINSPSTPARAVLKDPAKHSFASPLLFAIPLSIAGLLVVIVVVIGFHRRNKFLREGSQDFKTPLSGTSCHKHSEEPDGSEKEDIYTRVYLPQVLCEKRQPRLTTKEPFHGPHDTALASVATGTLSPRIPPPSNGRTPEHHSHRRKAFLPDGEAGDDSMATGQRSSVPACGPTPLKAAYVRQCGPKDRGSPRRPMRED